MRPDRKSQVRPGPRFFRTYKSPEFKHARAALRARAQRLLRAKVRRLLAFTGSTALSEVEFEAQIVSEPQAGRERLPCLLRKPVSGPMKRLVMSSATSSGDHSRPETTFQSEKSHFWHWNLR